MDAVALRISIDLIEAAQAGDRTTFRAYLVLVEQDETPWQLVYGKDFAKSFKAMARKDKSLADRIDAFTKFKLAHPLQQANGSDRPFVDHLRGFWHYHLKRDIVLIYRRLKGNKLELSAVSNHDEYMDKRRLASLELRLAA